MSVSLDEAVVIRDLISKTFRFHTICARYDLDLREILLKKNADLIISSAFNDFTFMLKLPGTILQLMLLSRRIQIERRASSMPREVNTPRECL